ncbi:MAG: class I SAM-dependent methyltransferase [Patescibacteria group bacterium]
MKRDKYRGKKFWEREYKKGGHFALSERPSEDLVAFTRWLVREYGQRFLNTTSSVLDLGCGNGRNLVYLAREFGMRGTGYDTSAEAIGAAQKISGGVSLTYEVRSIAEPLPLPDAGKTLVLDMMASHYLPHTAREALRTETARVLKPGGWLFLKTFLREEDIHAARLLREHPGKEAGSYVHPEIGLEEHVFTEEELLEELAPYFTVHKVKKSHRHMKDGRAWKRRSISVYAQKT